MVLRLKGKIKDFQGKIRQSSWLGSRDSNPDSMILSHVSFKYFFNNTYGKVKLFWSHQKNILMQSSQFQSSVLSFETSHIGGLISAKRKHYCYRYPFYVRWAASVENCSHSVLADIDVNFGLIIYIFIFRIQNWSIERIFIY